MRTLTFLLLLALAEDAYAELFGELLWESQMKHENARQIRSGKNWLLPHAPIGGTAGPDAVRIAIIDSGVALKHPQLAGYLIEATDFTGEGPEDTLRHGTMVALIALFGQGQTVSVGAILSAKVTDKNGKIRQEYVINAIQWAATKNASVVNLSLGFKGTREQHKALCDSIEKYPKILFVAAAGNSGPDVDVFPAKCGSNNLISVAAAAPAGELESSSGKGDVAAPSRTEFIEEWRYYYEAAQRLARVGRFDEARKDYERALSIEPNPESELQLGLIEINKGRTDPAIQHFRRAIQFDPGIAEVHESLGTALFLEADYARAERSLREAIILYGDNTVTQSYRARAHFNLAQTLLKLGRQSDAKAEFLEVRRLAPNDSRINDILKDLERR